MAFGIIALALIVVLGLLPTLNRGAQQTVEDRLVSLAVTGFEAVVDSSLGSVLHQTMVAGEDAYIHYYAVQSESDQNRVWRLWSAPGSPPNPSVDASAALPPIDLPEDVTIDGRILRFQLSPSSALQDVTEGAAVDVTVFSLPQDLAGQSPAGLPGSLQVFSYSTIFLPR